MICGHCQVAFHPNVRRLNVGPDAEAEHVILYADCPECKLWNIFHASGRATYNEYGDFEKFEDVKLRRRVFPWDTTTRSAPIEVPDHLRADYDEAALLLSVSPKASAAMSRRCLQATIREKMGISKRSLDKEIDAVIEQNLVPSELAGQLDAVRHIGNFAAHPMKDTESGVIIDVEPGEAEWNLDVLDGLFDYWYVLPAKTAHRKAAINEKLKSLGKEPI